MAKTKAKTPAPEWALATHTDDVPPRQMAQMAKGGA